jgi:isopenicillin N synthase-like dioxygenase
VVKKDGIEQRNLSSSLLRVCRYNGVEAEVEVGGDVGDVGGVGDVGEQDSKRATEAEAGGDVGAVGDVGGVREQDKGSKDRGSSKNWFGAHTDSSFITIALLSSTPGLDIVDQKENRWVSKTQL